MSLFSVNNEPKGELLQLRNKLNSNNHSDRKEAAKRVISIMRSGENVSCLFSSMLKCCITADIELKKLIYLYIVKYASDEPEQSIMAVNAFIQDSKDSNPFVRALAVRNMCRIKLDTVAQHMILPLKQVLSDRDPYVRKTAALAVSKLYDVIPEQVESSQMLNDLVKLLNDENPMVISNTVASLFEINEKRTTPTFILDEKTVTPLLSALTQCNVWVMVNLLDSLSHYKPLDAKEADFLIDRLIPFLKNSNSAVIIGTFRCIYFFLEKSTKSAETVLCQIVPPFISLISSADPEIQFVVLRTLTLFVQKYPSSLDKDIRIFYVKYNDPSYVKMEKLNIIRQVVTVKNVMNVYNEIEEYCNSVDVGFVKKSIQTLGEIATTIESSVRRAVEILFKLVESKADYTVEQSIIVVADILRKFPGEFESIISVVCSNLGIVKNPASKSAALWILGEYCKIIENPDQVIDPFLDSFIDEPVDVQYQILTAMVKLYVSNPEGTRDQIQFILTEATKESVAPDVRNRALVYWRVLSADPETARRMVNFEKKLDMKSSREYNDSVLSELISNLGTVSGTLYISASNFSESAKYVPEDEGQYYDTASHEWIMTFSDDSINVFADWQNMMLNLKVVNKLMNPLSDFAIAINKNPFGLSINQPNFPHELQYADSFEISIGLFFDHSMIGNPGSSYLEFAIRTNIGAKHFTTTPSLYSLCKPVQTPNFDTLWGSLGSELHTKISCKLDIATVSSRGVCINQDVNGTFRISFSINGQNFLVKATQSYEYIEANIKGPQESIQMVTNALYTLLVS